MNEEFLYYLWKHGKYAKNRLKTTSGDQIIVLEPGTHNMNAGPDFFNAKIRIGNTLWAGNVEVHTRSSDWYRHEHHLDNSYDNVILQIVLEDDKPVTRESGEEVPTMIIEYDDHLWTNYTELIKSEKWIKCADKIDGINVFSLRFWMESLAIERVEKKSQYISDSYKRNANSWEEALYQCMARGFGLKVNADPFERLARSIPLKILAKHKDNIDQLEALLFGQAGFLDEETGDDYYLSLRTEYQFLLKKYDLNPIEKHNWKFLRLRPYNFPTIRIAQFANLIYRSSGLLSKLLDIQDINALYELLGVSYSPYWQNHFVFNKDSKHSNKNPGKSMLDGLIINVISPFLFLYGKTKRLDVFKERSIYFLEKLKPENNLIIRNWKDIGIDATNSFESQALIQLKNEYCSEKKCLYCPVGNQLINQG